MELLVHTRRVNNVKEDIEHMLDLVSISFAIFREFSRVRKTVRGTLLTDM